MPRRRVLCSLKKPRVLQSWDPINLYNLSRLGPQATRERTFFQQKWTAKSLSRAYHGEQIREGQWERQFSRYIPSVVPMDAALLARSDGSDMAAGRGRGKDEKLGRSNKPPKAIPYMSMVYYPQERRLDTAIFRALFASSARQARQMVVHGHVQVNGKKMIYPGYLLNPGDMFTVDREMVLWATGSGERKGHLMDKIRKSLQRHDERLQFRAERRERKAKLALEQSDKTDNPTHFKKESEMSKSQASKSVVSYEDPLKPKPITKHLEKLNQINFSWRTRNWMSAFAFIPRYLEVNQNVCSAVYLRHPVARPGLAEVPSPFAAETQTLVFQWYLRRR